MKNVNTSIDDIPTVEAGVGKDAGADGDTTWMKFSRCADMPPSVFFPSDGVGVDAARRICAECPVQEPCLEYALANRIDHGVWGGTSERQRRRILRARRLRVAATTDT